jgi:hypothetical protein
MRKSQINIFLVAGVVTLFLLSGCVSGIVSTSLSTIRNTSQEKNAVTNNDAIITSYVGGVPHSQTISYESGTYLKELFSALVSANAHDSFSAETQHIQQQILLYAEQQGLLPAGTSADMIFEQLGKRNQNVAPHIFGGVLPVSNTGTGRELFCNFVSTGEGAAFPIIILPRFIPIIMAPIPRLFVGWKTPLGITSVGGLVSRTGFIASGQQQGLALGFWGIGFSIFLPPVMAYGMFGYALYAKVSAEYMEYYPPNTPPEITQTDPVDGEQMVPVTTTELRFEINDADGDLMTYNVTTYPDIGSGSGGLKPDGIYSISLSELESLTTYDCLLQVTDGKDSTGKTITFTTEAIAPIVSNPLPKDNALFVPIEISNLSFNLKDYQGDLMDWTVETQPDIGSGGGNSVNDGRYNVAIGGLNYFTTYTWFVNVTDGENWMKRTFVFRTIAEGTMVFEPTDDSYVSSTAPDQNAGNLDSLSIRSGGSSNNWWAAPTIKFNLSSLPLNSVVLSATLNLYYYAYADGNPVGRHLVMYRFLGDWVEESINWNNMPSINPTQTTVSYVPSTPETWITWDVTNDVQHFFDGSIGNYGWIIKDETTGGLPLTYIRPKEYSSVSPYLIIEIDAPK